MNLNRREMLTGAATFAVAPVAAVTAMEKTRKIVKSNGEEVGYWLQGPIEFKRGTKHVYHAGIIYLHKEHAHYYCERNDYGVKEYKCYGPIYVMTTTTEKDGEHIHQYITTDKTTVDMISAICSKHNDWPCDCG